MIRRIWAIALNTHREAIRQKILYVLVFFSAILILFSLFMGQLSLHADTKIVKDMGLASIMIFGSLLSIFVGIGLVFKEIDRRTIYTILSKPVSRGEFVLGKFIGLAVTIGLVVVCMTALWMGVLSLYREPLDFNLLKAVLLIYTELCVLIAAALVFSSYSSSLMSALFALSFLVLGHLTDDFAVLTSPRAYQMMAAPEMMDQAVGYTLLGVIRIMEVFNLDHFVINAKVVHRVHVDWRWVVNSLFYGLCWLMLLLTSAIWLFRRKDLQ